MSETRGIEDRPPEDALDAALGSDESVVWRGRPVPEVYASRGWPVPFLVAGSAFLAFGVGNLVALAERAPRKPPAGGRGPAFEWFDVVFGWVSLVVLTACAIAGAVLVTSPWWMKRRANHLVYAVTTHRLLIVESWALRPPWVSSILSFEPTELGSVPRETFDLTADDLFYALRAEDEPAAIKATERLLQSEPKSHPSWHEAGV